MAENPSTTIAIGGDIIGTGHPYVVAEMAWAHDGSRDLAMAIVDAAADAGANSLNIHLTDLEAYMVRSYGAGPGRVSAGNETDSVWNYLDRINLTTEDWAEVARHTKERNLALAIMPNDWPSLELAKGLDPALWTISPAVFEELDFVAAIAQTQKPMLVRVGGATLGEIELVLRTILDQGNSDIVLLHGLQNYPTKPEHTDLLRLGALKTIFGTLVGLADHIDADDPLASSVPLMSLGLGASVIEKHVTHDRAKRGEDHESAMNPDELAAFVGLVRQAATTLGTAEFRPLTDAEMQYRLVARKRLVAATPIKAGSRIEAEHLATKRADEGSSPLMLDTIVGRVAAEDIDIDRGVSLDQVQ